MIFAIKVILKLCYDICNKLEELPESTKWSLTDIFKTAVKMCIYYSKFVLCKHKALFMIELIMQFCQRMTPERVGSLRAVSSMLAIVLIS